MPMLMLVSLTCLDKTLMMMTTKEHCSKLPMPRCCTALRSVHRMKNFQSTMTLRLLLMMMQMMIQALLSREVLNLRHQTSDTECSTRVHVVCTLLTMLMMTYHHAAADVKYALTSMVMAMMRSLWLSMAVMTQFSSYRYQRRYSDPKGVTMPVMTTTMRSCLCQYNLETHMVTSSVSTNTMLNLILILLLLVVVLPMPQEIWSRSSASCRYCF